MESISLGTISVLMEGLDLRLIPGHPDRGVV